MMVETADPAVKLQRPSVPRCPKQVWDSSTMIKSLILITNRLPVPLSQRFLGGGGTVFLSFPVSQFHKKKSDYDSYKRGGTEGAEALLKSQPTHPPENAGTVGQAAVCCETSIIYHMLNCPKHGWDSPGRWDGQKKTSTKNGTN
jgi:hypothetical protein